jgi:ABC-type polysaccharide/polyol phosphate export permease
MAWSGEYSFVLRNLVEKDFKVRYRNMSLGIFWSLLNPLIMMAVLTFVFTQIFGNASGASYPISVLCALVPLSFFQIAWSSGTTSLQENAHLIKKIPVPRQIFPVASVLSNCMHLIIQVGLLLGAVIFFGRGVNRYWAWLPVIWALEIIFVLGLALAFSALNVYVRDMRYVVESANTVLFWLVPVFYSFSLIPLRFREVYQYNPVAAVVLMLRNVLLDGRPPLFHTLSLLTVASFAMLAVGLTIFGMLTKGFYEHL